MDFFFTVDDFGVEVGKVILVREDGAIDFSAAVHVVEEEDGGDYGERGGNETEAKVDNGDKGDRDGDGEKISEDIEELGGDELGVGIIGEGGV